MTDKPASSKRGEADLAARRAREAAALRENLRRRKEQQRAAPSPANRAATGRDKAE